MRGRFYWFFNILRPYHLSRIRIKPISCKCFIQRLTFKFHPSVLVWHTQLLQVGRATHNLVQSSSSWSHVYVHMQPHLASFIALNCKPARIHTLLVLTHNLSTHNHKPSLPPEIATRVYWIARAIAFQAFCRDNNIYVDAESIKLPINCWKVISPICYRSDCTTPSREDWVHIHKHAYVYHSSAGFMVVVWLVWIKCVVRVRSVAKVRTLRLHQRLVRWHVWRSFAESMRAIYCSTASSFVYHDWHIFS